MDSAATLFAFAKEGALVDEVATLSFDGARTNDSWDVARHSAHLLSLVEHRRAMNTTQGMVRDWGYGTTINTRDGPSLIHTLNNHQEPS